MEVIFFFQLETYEKGHLLDASSFELREFRMPMMNLFRLFLICLLYVIDFFLRRQIKFLFDF